MRKAGIRRINVISCAVRCEGDEVLPAFIECLNNGGDARQIGGISFRENERIVHTPEGEPPEIPATIPDVSLIEGFERATPQLAGRRAVINALQTTRGCEFRCKFCPTLKLFQGSYRSRDIDRVIADIKRRMVFNGHFFVVDNDFCSDRKKTKALLNRLIEEKLASLDGLPIPEPVRDYEDGTPYRSHVVPALIPALARMALIRFRKSGARPAKSEPAEVTSP